jgi:hypothetical protein
LGDSILCQEADPTAPQYRISEINSDNEDSDCEEYYVNNADEIRGQRISGLYADDNNSQFRCSHQNPFIKQVYDEFLGEPSGHKAHELLHTRYVKRPVYIK